MGSVSLANWVIYEKSKSGAVKTSILGASGCRVHATFGMQLCSPLVVCQAFDRARRRLWHNKKQRSG
jgi:hypothetical protein